MASKNTQTGELIGTPFRFDRPQLAAIMEENNDTHATLAHDLGVYPQKFSNIWNGKLPFTLEMVGEIMRRYHLTEHQVVDIFIYQA